jgi:hypothetical protein
MSFARNTQAAMKAFGKPAFSAPTFSSNSYKFNDIESGSSTKRIIMGLVATIIIILMVLVIIHYTVTPIFKIKKDGTGIIPIPGMSADDGAIYWENSPSHGVLEEKDTILERATGYSIQMDICLDDINQDRNATIPRPLFLRYNPAGILRNPVDFSMGIFLAPNVNDIHVIVRNSKEDSQIIVIKNIPAKVVIRIGVIVGDNYFEAYRDGELVSSRTFSNGIRSGSIGRIWGSPGSPIPDAVVDEIEKRKELAKKADAVKADSKTAKDMFKTATDDILQCNANSGGGALGGLMNLHVWTRTISPGEMKNASPAKPDMSAFTGKKKNIVKQIFGSILPV